MNRRSTPFSLAPARTDQPALWPSGVFLLTSLGRRLSALAGATVQGQVEAQPAHLVGEAPRPIDREARTLGHQIADLFTIAHLAETAGPL